ncbi:MAG: helix-hairpin-helix domain-containing protein [Albidovulum sp.]|uniref:helix-hairpin-helix domain-containing protein n=1 Tax=Albidovulum sp. TaxID=1872424 RepID=UPI003CAEE3AF
MSELLTIPGIGLSTKSALEAMGIHTKTDLVHASIQDLTTIRGVTVTRAEDFIKAAQSKTTAPSSQSKKTKVPGDVPTNVIKLVPKKPKADAKAALKAAKRMKKKAKAKLKTATVKLDEAVKALKKYKKAALKDKKKEIRKSKAAK